MMKLCLICLFFLSQVGQAGIQANMHIKADGDNKQINNQKMAVSLQEGSFRMDTELPNKQGKVSVIYNQKKDKTFSVMHKQKKAMIIENNQNMIFMNGNGNLAAAKKAGYKVEKISNENFAGQNCDVYKISGGKGKNKIKEGKAWFATKLNGMMLKMISKNQDGSNIEMWMSNIKESKLAQSLFLPPNNYQVSKMPDVSAFSQSNMMQDMQKMQKLPKGQREKAMQNWKAEMMKKAKALKEQYGN